MENNSFDYSLKVIIVQTNANQCKKVTILLIIEKLMESIVTSRSFRSPEVSNEEIFRPAGRNTE